MVFSLKTEPSIQYSKVDYILMHYWNSPLKRRHLVTRVRLEIKRCIDVKLRSEPNASYIRPDAFDPNELERIVFYAHCDIFRHSRLNFHRKIMCDVPYVDSSSIRYFRSRN